MRTGKTVGSTVTKYNYLGSKLVQMTQGSNTLNFTYDRVGAVGVKYNGTQYYYLRNAQGDIMGIVNTSGTVVVEYTYDAWGRLLTTTGSMASTLGEINPLRYRGYVYDTGLYYDYILPCVEMIREGRQEDCLAHYCEMVRQLQARFSLAA